MLLWQDLDAAQVEQGVPGGYLAQVLQRRLLLEPVQQPPQCCAQALLLPSLAPLGPWPYSLHITQALKARR